MNKTILVIDDDDMLRQTLAKGLRASKFNVLTASGADAATKILARVSVDSIVLDRMMVGTDGLSFLKNLRTSGNNTPVIMLTAMTGTENTIDGLSSGADDYMSKPFSLQELVLRLKNIMKNTPTPTCKMPHGLILTDDAFFVETPSGSKLLALSGEEEKLLRSLTTPMGNIVPASPMVAKRLRNKLNMVLSSLDLITVRSRGYKLVCHDKDCTTEDRL